MNQQSETSVSTLTTPSATRPLTSSTSRLGTVFWVSLIILILFVMWGVISPEHLALQAEVMFSYTTHTYGWFYLLATVFFMGFSLYLALSRYGTIKLGKDHDLPEFSYFSWIGMLFSAGFGVGLVFWGVAEPMTHYYQPIPGIEAQSPQAARTAMNYAMFHWGIHQWAVFTVVGLALAYFQFRKNYTGLISSSFRPLIGKRSQGFLGNSIDILSVISTVMGVAASLGMGILQISGGMNQVFGLPNTAYLQLTVIAILLGFYLLSATTGLKKGIKILSNLNLGMTFALMLFVLFLGPSVFILNSFTVGLGDYIANFTGMSFNLSPYDGNTWTMDWTVLYWAWAISWAPFVGAFIARISRGRTIREFVFGVMFVPPLVAIVWMAVFGGTALHMEVFRDLPIAEAVHQDKTAAFFLMLENLPLGFWLSVFSLILIMTFLVTSADSATFVLGMMTSKGNLNPHTSVKMIWGILIAAIAAVLILSSGLSGLQTASLVAALPFTLIVVLMCFSLLMTLSKEKL
ncbi:BCCT family transporter [Ammoniphilus sp. YIM 78166]|uniref:BCCT family transporter n=1 Tax=Ammoniphilus sp. YIM 78166 TaxID=1644106 RepID=UPI00106F775E|nr:BCCT family transporter [Ammoniphilus sp. YIM 78166]